MSTSLEHLKNLVDAAREFWSKDGREDNFEAELTKAEEYLERRRRAVEEVKRALAHYHEAADLFGKASAKCPARLGLDCTALGRDERAHCNIGDCPALDYEIDWEEVELNAAI